MVDWGVALRVVILGVAMVFAVMGFLALIMWLMGVVYSRQERIRLVLSRLTWGRLRVPTAEEAALTDEEVAAVTAAILAYLEEPETVTDRERMPSSSSQWVLEVREQLISSHIRRIIRRWAPATTSNWTLTGREMLMGEEMTFRG